MSIRESLAGPGNPEMAESLDNLASLYARQKKWNEAAPFYERALQIRTTTLGPEHQTVTAGLDRLASVYTAQEKYVEAEPLYKQSFTIREKETLQSLRNLATLYVAREKYAEADPLYKLALAIYDKNPPQKKVNKSKKDQLKMEPPPPYLVETLEEYAAVLRKLKRKGEASKLESRAKPLRQQLAAFHGGDKSASN
jgi:tetratricopeptide (TPR) repeat protein